MNFHTEDVRAVAGQLDANTDRGLSSSDAEARLEKYGPNRLKAARKKSAATVLLAQFRSIVILLLVAAAVVAAVTARVPETIALILVIAVNTLIGFVSEWQAIRSMEALRAREEQRIRVRRDGKEVEITADALVPGDIVLLSANEMTPADLRLTRADGLRIGEAALTGESVPVVKGVNPVAEDTPLAERDCMAYKGTTVVDGEGEGIVCATGSSTELGKIASMAEEAEEEALPLQKRLDKLGRHLAYITIAVAIIIAVVGLIAGRDTVIMIETAIALGVAAIPEGLPIVATIALARGMWIMARYNALVNRLPAVETLGATHVIFTDKTGTLTENRIRLECVVIGPERIELGGGNGAEEPAHDRLQELLELGALCCDAQLADDEEAQEEAGEEAGEPMEIAILRAAQDRGIAVGSLRADNERVHTEAFSRETMMMATVHKKDDELFVAVKGAPRKVLECCTHALEENGEARSLDGDAPATYEQRIDDLAGEGLRVLAVARKDAASAEKNPYEGLCLMGFLGLRDPERSGVSDTIVECRKAGLKPVMVTGDEPATARAIAESIELMEPDGPDVIHGSELEELDQLPPEEHDRLRKSSVFARVTPEQKLKLIALFQESGDVVAMTGDGINDAPALKKADIGIAMGKRGTEAAKQVSDMILQDDRFGTIVDAVKQGRIIFANIRKSVMFMLCTNVAEVIAVGLASLVNAPLPLQPLQILYLNVLTDVFPALALGVGKGDPQVMDQPPRARSEAVLTRHHWMAVGGWSTVIAACVLAALALAMMGLGFEKEQAVTVSFLTLGFGKLWFVLNLRDREAARFSNDIVRNPWIWGSIVLCVGLLCAAVYWPFLSEHLGTANPGLKGWALIAGLSLTPALLGLFVPGIRFYSKPSNNEAGETSQ